MSAGDRELLKAWVEAIGPPISRRPIKYGKRRLTITLPTLDSLRRAPAPDYYTERAHRARRETTLDG